jgi:predicted glycosyltransferase involved in capsule biosynthesis
MITYKNSILFSIILCGKNDNYAGNFIQRMQFNLDKLNDNIDKLNVNDIEIIAVDWGSEIPLTTILNIENYKFTKFIHVTTDIAHKYSPDSSFSSVHALNTGYRRSQGQYIFFIDADSYISYDYFVELYNLVKQFNSTDNIFYWASRYHLPYEIHSSVTNINDLDKFISILNWKENKDNWRHDKVNLNSFQGGAMGLLLSKNICEESTLFYEKLNKWGWLDIEIHNRISSKYPCLGDLEDHNMYFFHLDHHNIAAGGQNGSNYYTNSNEFNANDSSWGLINENLTLYKK